MTNLEKMGDNGDKFNLKTFEEIVEQLPAVLSRLGNHLDDKKSELRQDLSIVSTAFDYYEAVTDRQKNEITIYRELQEITRDINSDLTLMKLLEKVVDLSISLIQADRGFIFIKDDQGEFVLNVARNKFKRDLREEDHKISNTVIRRVIETGQSIFEADVSRVEEITDAASIADLKIRSVMCIPLEVGMAEHVKSKTTANELETSGLLGILYVDSRRQTEESRFKGDSLQFLQALADQASVALNNALLTENSVKDSLTGLYIRPHFEKLVVNSINQHKQQNESCSVLIVTIDYFLTLNEEFGYRVGDGILKAMTQLISNTVGRTAICSRYRVDRFAVLLPQTNCLEAIDIVERLFDEMKNLVFPNNIMTICVGVSCYPEHCLDEDLSAKAQATILLQKAEEAIRFSDNSGQNRSVIWDDAVHKSRDVDGNISDLLTGNLIKDYATIEKLLEAIRFGSSPLAVTKIFPRIIDMIIEITDAERAILLLEDDDSGRLNVELVRCKEGATVSETSGFNEAIASAVYEKSEPVFISDAAAGLKSRDKELHRSVMCVPLHVKSKNVGAIYIDSSASRQVFTKSDLSFVYTFTNQIGDAIERAMLYTDLEERVFKKTRELTKKENVLKVIKGELIDQSQVVKTAQEKARLAHIEKEKIKHEIYSSATLNMQLLNDLMILLLEKSDEGVKQTFKKIQRRINIINFLYDALYKSGDQRNDGFSSYFEQIKKHINDKVSPASYNISLKTDEILIGYDQALICGLILMELLNNAINHAFPDNETGEIEVNISESESEWVELKVKDSGVGFFDKKHQTATDGLGLKIISLLVEQLRGTMETDTSNGTITTVRFPSLPTIAS